MKNVIFNPLPNLSRLAVNVVKIRIKIGIRLPFIEETIFTKYLQN